MQLNSIIKIVDDNTAENWKAGLNERQLQEMSKVSVVGIGSLSEIEQEGYYVPENAGIGDTLVKNPYGEPYYQFVQDAKISFVHDKFNKICEIAQLLGAVSIELTSYSSDEQNNKKNVSGAANINAVKLEGGAQIEDNASIFNGFKVKDELVPVRVLDEESYQCAQEFANKYRLNMEPDIASLIRARNPKHPSTITSRHLQIYMSQEIDRILDITAKISWIGIGEANANININAKESTREILDIEVCFPKGDKPSDVTH